MANKILMWLLIVLVFGVPLYTVMSPFQMSPEEIAADIERVGDWNSNVAERCSHEIQSDAWRNFGNQEKADYHQRQADALARYKDSKEYKDHRSFGQKFDDWGNDPDNGFWLVGGFLIFGIVILIAGKMVS